MFQKEVLVKQMRGTLIHIHLCTEAYERETLTFPKDLTFRLGIDRASTLMIGLHSFYYVTLFQKKRKGINPLIKW